MLESKIRSKVSTIHKILTKHRIKKGYFTKKGSKKLIVIMYHGIDLVESTKYNYRFYSKDHFEKHIILLKKYCNILSHSDFVNEKYAADRPNVVITFDDGYLNNYKYALPILEKYQAHAYFFITGLDTISPRPLWADAVDIVSKHAKQHSKVTVSGINFELKGNEFVSGDGMTKLDSFVRKSASPGYVEKEEMISQLLSLYDFTKQEELRDYWEIMNAEEIRKTSLSKSITIGSHGFYHNNLGSLNNKDAVAEVEKSRSYLQNIIQKDVTTIGFPDGSYTTELNQSLFELGFIKQFLVDYYFSDSGNKPYVYDRLGLYPYLGNPNQLLYKIIN